MSFNEQDIIYHATRKTDLILESGSLKSFFNRNGKDQETIKATYEMMYRRLADLVKDYHQRNDINLSLCLRAFVAKRFILLPHLR